ncbi:MAG: hypothetical protein Q9219_006353 [cf. Caloplaca sp. 3 TL-2023]
MHFPHLLPFVSILTSTLAASRSAPFPPWLPPPIHGPIPNIPSLPKPLGNLTHWPHLQVPAQILSKDLYLQITAYGDHVIPASLTLPIAHYLESKAASLRYYNATYHQVASPWIWFRQELSGRFDYDKPVMEAETSIWPAQAGDVLEQVAVWTREFGTREVVTGLVMTGTEPLAYLQLMIRDPMGVRRLETW